MLRLFIMVALVCSHPSHTVAQADATSDVDATKVLDLDEPTVGEQLTHPCICTLPSPRTQCMRS